MERISGPHRGFYVAAFASETGEPGESFLGHAKICRRRPENYWDANCLVKLCGERLHADAKPAIDEVLALAMSQLRTLAPQPETATA